MGVLSEEQGRELLGDFTEEVVSGRLRAAQAQKKADETARKAKKRHFVDKEGSRPPVVAKSSGVFRPSGLPTGRVDKIPEEEF